MEANADQVASGRAAWQTTSIEIERLRRDIYTTSGFLDDAAAEQTAGVVSSTFVQDGRILSPRINECRPGNSAPSRATLREGDLAVVLVRRVGASALVTAEHAGCTATRSIGIIRAEPHIVRWLRIWLQTPTAKARIDEDVTAHVEPTISLDTLRRMLFPLPPPDVITAYHRAFGLIEEMSALYQETARKAVELADALHDDWASTIPPWETRPLAKVAKPKTGKGSERSLPPLPTDPTTDVTDVIAPKDLYDLPVPHVPRFRLSSPANDGEVHPPGTLMLSTRSDGAHIAVPSRPATPLRGVVAVRPMEDEDGWWLLHELRSRSSDITRLAQGQNGREISARALKRLEVTWPDRFTRTNFHTTADPLHAMVRLLVTKIATLHTLRDALLRDISAKAGVLREPTTEPEEQSAPAPRPTAGPASRGMTGNDRPDP
ncbi:restriction endonuclease subunit S domain-containing protein [Streptomyces lonegramiae]|uniref:Type I restriction enzyme, S subunit n=1 Tax=Streptomyces lonegramiae TaxID=3075524 RepID=A0ABU2XT56_9ACTN|nr:hypothetical protein [Streptomyces sp. DSM 41529]MDT0548245.1 hypothetical protein [Streptomyces sp. DSM 41529]